MKNKGITLIALVITIIVLLILAGVTINTLTGDNGLITKAQKAKENLSDAEIGEKIQLAQLEYQTAKYSNTNKTELEYMEESLSNTFGETVTVKKMGKEYKVMIGNTKTVYRLKANGTTYKYEEMDPTNVYAKLDQEGTLYLRSTKLNGYENETKWNSTSIYKVIIEEPIAPSSGFEMLKGCTNLREIINIENLHTENMSNMANMFYDCKSLEKLDVSKFETSRVSNMYGVFIGCESLKKIDVQGFDVSNVTIITNIFSGCSNLKEIDINGFDINKFTSLSGFFYGCESLTKIDISDLDTSKITNMHGLFWNCTSLKLINLGGKFSMNNVSDYDYMLNNVPGDVKILTKKDTIEKIKEMYPNFTNENFEIIQ